MFVDKIKPITEVGETMNVCTVTVAIMNIYATTCLLNYTVDVYTTNGQKSKQFEHYKNTYVIVKSILTSFRLEPENRIHTRKN